jgi:hypothetical protein
MATFKDREQETRIKTWIASSHLPWSDKCELDFSDMEPFDALMAYQRWLHTPRMSPDMLIKPSGTLLQISETPPTVDYRYQ